MPRDLIGERKLIVDQVAFDVEVWNHYNDGMRALCKGPRPGYILFTSFIAKMKTPKEPDWNTIQFELRQRWRERPEDRKNKWYGHNGIYATEFPIGDDDA